MHECGSGKGLTSLQQALDHYARLAPLPEVSLPLLEAGGQVLASDAHAQCDLPRFTQSAMDGYALRAADQPGDIRLVGEVPAGQVFGRQLMAGEAVRIFTGAALPAGADTVARQEIVTLEGDRLRLSETLEAGRDVRLQGEEMRAGEPLMAAGLELTPGRVAALAMAGITRVRVRARPRVAVIITGNEVVPQGGAVAAGGVHDANWPLIDSWLRQQGLECVPCVWAGDELAELSAALQQVAGKADLIITTGGASVGRYDYLAAAAEQSGFNCDFHRVAQRPGKPVWFGRKAGCLLLALPGNPAAVLAGLYVHAAAILKQLQGLPLMDGWQLGRLREPAQAHDSLTFLRRMRLSQDDDAGLWLSPLPHQASHMLSNLASASALVWLPAGAGELQAGAALPFVTLS